MTAKTSQASTKVKTSAAKRKKVAKTQLASETQAQIDVMSSELEASTPELLESLPQNVIGHEPKAINSTQAVAMLAGGVVIGRALGWM